MEEPVLQAFSAIREGNNHRADWILEWLYDESLLPEQDNSVQHFIRRLLHYAKSNNITLSEKQIQTVTVEKTPDRDWLSYSYQQIPAFEIGTFFIHGSHNEDPVPDDKIGLQIDAATAFGSGEHGTTKGCLEAMLYLQDLGQCPWNVLDMGTGSGILAIAAWKLWKTPVLAIDNDTESVRVTKHHADLNNVRIGKMDFSCEEGDGFAAEIVQQKKPYDLIIANILASALKEMVADLIAVSDENGYIILSGILNEQADDVIETYEAFDGCTLHKKITYGDWTTLIMHHAA